MDGKRLVRGAVVLALSLPLPSCASRERGIFAPPTSASDVHLILEERTYPVRGRTVQSVGRSLRQAGRSQIGRDAMGLTRWSVRWSWHAQAGDDGCHLDEVEVTVAIEMTLPEWQDRKASGSTLVDAWDRFERALWVHESGHRDLAMAAGNEILSTLRAFQTPDCAAVDEAARARAREILARYERQSALYERTTGTGRTQGAVWPPG